ncbi:hypothetical protein BRC89_02705 [Halobacteriales archaeon QS_4_70_19]|nr:MAG: hypothetical protein BRC89_02705 [Halobacteriales archaeon QS_4_70_19]
MTRTRWLYPWGVPSVAAGRASLLVPLYVVALGDGPATPGVLAEVAGVDRATTARPRLDRLHISSSFPLFTLYAGFRYTDPDTILEKESIPR